MLQHVARCCRSAPFPAERVPASPFTGIGTRRRPANHLRISCTTSQIWQHPNRRAGQHASVRRVVVSLVAMHCLFDRRRSPKVHVPALADCSPHCCTALAAAGAVPPFSGVRYDCHMRQSPDRKRTAPSSRPAPTAPIHRAAVTQRSQAARPHRPWALLCFAAALQLLPGAAPAASDDFPIRLAADRQRRLPGHRLA